MGDGGHANDPLNAAQDPATLVGKMLRIDVSVGNDDPAGYRVPADNPFVDGLPIQALGEIWAFGLRNPWRYSIDDVGAGETGALVIADVGKGAREEINYEPSGAGGRNYGWCIREGRLPNEDIEMTTPAYGPWVDPVWDYDPFRLAVASKRRVTLSWSLPDTADGPTMFRIGAGSVSGEVNLAILTVDGVSRGLTVDAPPGRSFVRMRGINNCGPGGASAEIAVTVP